MKPIFGIDLGGTKIEGVAINPSDYSHTIARLRIPTEADQGYVHVTHQIQKLIGLLEKETGNKVEKIGIGTPGVLDPELQTMKNCNSTHLNGKPLLKDLEDLLKIPVLMANDANCFALAETKMGAVPEVLENPELVFGVIMGTGVGGGIVAHGKIVSGRHGIGGEWGHNFLDETGGDCYCGRVGCTETILSGPASERFYENRTGTKLNLKEIYTRYTNQSDPHATATIHRLLHFFGKGIASIINVLDPAAIVLGGGVGNIDALYTNGVEEIKKYLFNHRLDTLILKPKLGDSAGVFGAAMLVA